MSIPRSDPPQADAWPALYEAGGTIREIAAASGRSWHAVRLELLQRGVVMRQGGPERGDWYAEAALLRAEGATLPALGRRYGVTRQAVAKALRQA